MTTPAAPAHAATSSGPVFVGAVRSEWTKFWTVRSTYWTLLAALVVTVGLGALISGSVATFLNQPGQGGQGPQGQQMPDPVSLSLSGTAFGLLAMMVLGVLVISSEYGTGMIRSSLAAVPQRLRFLLAKTLVFTVVVLVVGEAASFAAFFIGNAFFAAHDLGVSLGDTGVLRAVVGGGLYLAASGLFGLAVGALLRHTAGAIATAAVFLFVLPGITQALPGDWGRNVWKYFTTNAGQQIIYPTHGSAPDALSPWLGYGVYVAWSVAVLIAAAVLIRTRDA